jgi:hypothetical protein
MSPAFSMPFFCAKIMIILHLIYFLQTTEQCAGKNVNNCLNTNIYSNLEASGAVFTTHHFLFNLRMGPTS